MCGFKLDTLYNVLMRSTFHQIIALLMTYTISWSTAFNLNKSLLYWNTAHNLAALTHCIQRFKFNALTHWLDVSVTVKSCSSGHNPPHKVIAVLTHSLYIFITARCWPIAFNVSLNQCHIYWIESGATSTPWFTGLDLTKPLPCRPTAGTLQHGNVPTHFFQRFTAN